MKLCGFSLFQRRRITAPGPSSLDTAPAPTPTLDVSLPPPAVTVSDTSGESPPWPPSWWSQCIRLTSVGFVGRYGIENRSTGTKRQTSWPLVVPAAAPANVVSYGFFFFFFLVTHHKYINGKCSPSCLT